jgi:hypothetical protein
MAAILPERTSQFIGAVNVLCTAERARDIHPHLGIEVFVSFCIGPDAKVLHDAEGIGLKGLVCDRTHENQFHLHPLSDLTFPLNICISLIFITNISSRLRNQMEERKWDLLTQLKSLC